MPKGTGSLRHLLRPGWRENYELRDEFNSPLAAGSVNGTAAEPGPGTRTVTDTNSKLSIASGIISVATGGAALGDPGVWFPAQSAVGRMAIAKIAGTNNNYSVGWDSNTADGVAQGVNFFTTLRVLTYAVSAVAVGVVPSSGATTYVAVVKRSNGAFYFIKEATSYPAWTLLYIDATAGAATFPSVGIQSTGAVFTCDFLRVPRRLWLPVPLASDGFPTAFGTTDGTGHAETSGLGAGGGGLAWTQALGTWGISGAKANCSELGAGSIGVTTVTTPTVNVLADVGVTRAAGAAGLVLRYTDASNFLYAYHDGTNAALIEKVAGVDANVVAPTAATYSAGAVLRVVLDGTAARLFYNNAAVGAVGTTAITTGAKHGLWTNNTGPTLDNFVVYARGTGGEYAYLDRFIK